MAEVDFTQVFDAAPAPLAVLSPELVYLAVNRAYEKVSGHSRDELLGREVLDAFPGGPAASEAVALRTSLERVLAERETDVMGLQRYDVAVPGEPERLEERYWNIVNAPILGPDGEVRWIYHRPEEVTGFVHELRKAGASPPRGSRGSAIAKMLAIEAELFARSREIQEVNQRLRRAQAGERQTIEGLRRAMSRQREVVADASHDLRGPITGLQTRLQDALIDPDTDWRRIVLAALQDAERLGDIVSDLLELARLEAGTPPPLIESVDLIHLVEDELSRRHPPAVTITMRERPGPVVVRGSALQLARLLENLMTNAERHARGRIEVSVARDDGWAVLEVVDDGPGIPVADRKAVFSRFHRGSDARRADPAGTGLGLPIAREIAHAHGGTLHIADNPTGARLVLRLPRL
ncbi:ATP-binding protein [Actinomadura rugatobispora]|uniref:histidine kinase n=1 Tax=Actinomadura rugatobispora TaxID=1994 RepID=A0ABW1AIB0_9ACTN